jgi:hypothetical protein
MRIMGGPKRGFNGFEELAAEAASPVFKPGI